MFCSLHPAVYIYGSNHIISSSHKYTPQAGCKLQNILCECPLSSRPGARTCELGWQGAALVSSESLCLAARITPSQAAQASAFQCVPGLAGSSAGTATKLLPLRAALPSGGRGSPATRTPSRMIPTHSDRQTGSDPVPPRGRCSLDSNRWRSRFDPRRWLLSPGQPEEMDPSLKSQRSDGPGSTRDPRGLGGRPATPTQLASVRVAP